MRYGDDREVRRIFSVTDMAGLTGLTSKDLQRVDEELPQLRATRNRANKRVYLAEHTDALRLVALRLRQGVEFSAIRTETEGLSLEQVRERLGAAGPALMAAPVANPIPTSPTADLSRLASPEVWSLPAEEPTDTAMAPEALPVRAAPAASAVPVATATIVRNEEQLRLVRSQVAALRQELMGLLWSLRQP